jgi:hypothetical protein
MRDSSAALRGGDAELLRDRLQTDGYILLRSVIPAEAVQAGCRRITDEMGRGGWFIGDPAERVARAGGPSQSLSPADVAFAATNGTMLRPSEARAVSNAEDGAVQRVLEAPELYALFELLFGEPATTLDYKWFRAVPPPAEIGKAVNCFHCDKVREHAAPTCSSVVFARVRAAAHCARVRTGLHGPRVQPPYNGMDSMARDRAAGRWTCCTRGQQLARRFFNVKTNLC